MNKLLEFLDNKKLLTKFNIDFSNALKNYSSEEPEEFMQYIGNIKNATLKYTKAAYEISLDDKKSEYITITSDIYVKNDCIGWYKHLYDIHGNSFDDYLVIE